MQKNYKKHSKEFKKEIEKILIQNKFKQKKKIFKFKIYKSKIKLKNCK